MGPKIKIDGVYDKRTVRELDQVAIRDYGFDFRPLSFNFLQQYRFLELIDSCFSPLNRYFLHYSNERDYIVWKMINDLSSARSENMDGFHLEFSDQQDSSYYNQFGLPYYWHYSPQVNMKQVFLNFKYLKGIVIPFNIMEEIHQSGNFHNFTQNFHKSSYGPMMERKIELSLLLDWDSNIFPSLLEFFDFDMFSFAINHKTEICYRNVDLKRVKNQINHCRRIHLQTW